MQHQDIERNLTLLGEELQELGLKKPLRLLLIGGAYLITQNIGQRKTTGDIDVIVSLDHPLTPQEYHLFKSAVRFVAHDLGMSETWLNDLASEALTSTGNIPTGTSWRTFGKLVEIVLPPKDFILACKLLAGRPKDHGDIIALCKALRIKQRAQAQEMIDRYFPDRQFQELSGVPITLTTFFPAGG